MKHENNKIIEEYEKKQKRDRRDKIILIIIIILLLLFYIVVYRLGKIGYKQVATIPHDGTKTIKIYDKDTEITTDTELNVFANVKYNGESIISPKSEGGYKFYIENVTEDNVSYNINFLDEMDYSINMKYRLKIDNVYIKGNKDTYVGIEELSVQDIIVLKDSTNIFTLEWYWEDDDVNDTIVGSQKTDEQYKLNIKIEANAYVDEQRWYTWWNIQMRQ